MGDQIVAGNDEADNIEEHDVNDDRVIVYEGWFVPKPGIWFEFRAKEAVKSSHVWEDTVAVPIWIRQECANCDKHWDPWM